MIRWEPLTFSNSLAILSISGYRSASTHENPTHTTPQTRGQGPVISKDKVIDIMPVINSTEDIKHLLCPTTCRSRNPSLRRGGRFIGVGCRRWRRGGLAEHGEEERRYVAFDGAGKSASPSIIWGGGREGGCLVGLRVCREGWCTSVMAIVGGSRSAVWSGSDNICAARAGWWL